MKQQRRKDKGIPLQWILIVPFILQICLAVGLTGLSWQTGQAAVQDLAIQLQSKISDRIKDRTQAFLNTPDRINQINAGEIDTNQLDLNNPEQLIRSFINLQRVFAEGNHDRREYYGINHISLGKEDGTYLAVRRSEASAPLPFEVLMVTTQPAQIHTYLANRQGDRVLENIGQYNYDPRHRPWYEKAVQTGKPGWSDIYNYFSRTTLGISHIYPLYEKNSPKTLKGVLATDFDLGELSHFLQGMTIGKTGCAFIMERNYHLVATSQKEDLFIPEKDQTRRFDARQSQSLLVHQAANYLQTEFPNLGQIKDQQQRSFQTIEGEQFLQVIPLVRQEGLDWLLVVVIPKVDFTEQINENAHFTLKLCLVILLFSSLMGFLVYRQLSSWILHFSKDAQAIAFGQLVASNPYAKTPRIQELAILAQAFAQMRQQLQDSFAALESTNHELEARVEQRTQELQAANHTLHHLATVDALTEAANRRSFNDYLDQEWQKALQEGYPLAVILCDVDFFKAYNDTYGHQAGDACLQQVVVGIRRVVKRTEYLVARYGGEEFAVILPNTTIDGVRLLAVDLLQSVAALQIPHARSTVAAHVTVSLGICHGIPTPELSIDQLITTADRALYRAKAEGRNTYRERSIEAP